MYLSYIPLRRKRTLWCIGFFYLHFLRFANGDQAEKIKDESKKARDLMEQYWQWRLKEAPEFASRCGINKFDGFLEKYTEEALAYRFSNATAFMSTIKSINKHYLSHKDTVSLDVMEDMLNTYQQGFPYRMQTAYWPLNSIHSLFDKWTRLHQRTALDSAQGYENLISRYKAAAIQADQMVNLTRIAIATFNLTYSSNNETNTRGAAPEVSPEMTVTLMRNLVSPFEDIPYETVPSNSTRQDLLLRAKDVIASHMLPMAKKVNSFFNKEFITYGSDEIGLSQHLSGLELYEACLRWHLSENMTARQVHELGLREVDRIYGLMEKIKDRDSFGGDVREYIAHLKQNKENMYDSAEDMMTSIRKIMKNVKKRLRDMFSRIPTLPIILVNRSSETGPVGSYAGPTLDRSRPGTYFANTYKPQTSAKFNMMPVVLHEAEPGHHMQAAYNRDIGLPYFRQATDYSKSYAVPFDWPIYTAYVEGWGLYSEYLGEEFGFYEEPYGLLGRYSGEMLRACRLVVDTGIHAYGWSQERAKEYIANYTALSTEMIQSEVKRYVRWPGQSCAYKIGELKIKELRKMSEDHLGNVFDVREFHDRVLSLGPVPLHILESDIRAWLNLKASAVISSASVLCSNTCLILAVFLGMKILLHD